MHQFVQSFTPSHAEAHAFTPVHIGMNALLKGCVQEFIAAAVQRIQI